MRKSLESLLRQKSVWEFSGQYMNDPVDADAVEFKQNWFQTFKMDDVLASKLNKVGAILSVDPAFRLKQSNDFSGLVVTKTTEDNLVYVLEAKHCKVNPKGLVDEIFNLVEVYAPWKVLVETTAAQIILIDLLRSEMIVKNKFFIVEEVKSSTMDTKAIRIRGLIPQYANHRIFHAPNLRDLENELIEFPRGTHDDVVDALSHQVPYWKSMAPSPTKAEYPEGSWGYWKKNHMRPRNMTVIGRVFGDMVGRHG